MPTIKILEVLSKPLISSASFKQATPKKSTLFFNAKQISSTPQPYALALTIAKTRGQYFLIFSKFEYNIFLSITQVE